MNRSSLVLSAVMFGLLAGCAGSPIAVGRMTPEQITAISNKDLCFAYDRGQDQKPAVGEEVTRRRLDCSRVLLQAGIEPTGAARAGMRNIAPRGDCADVEFMGVFVTEAVVGIRGQFAKVRNKRNFTEIVEVGFYQDGKPMTARTEVKAGDIGSIQLAVSDRRGSSVHITSCQ
ncbi:MAG: hypothetical protein HYZ72_13595 [Deltaproteobacteria bacterium]|nr:hypothetical protein [Deltaproteobacteria bacterium]